MFSVSQQVLRNRRRMSALTTLQRRIAEKKLDSNNIAAVREQTLKLRQIFDELQVEEDRIQREILEIGQKINKLEQAGKRDEDTCKNEPK